MQNPPACGNAMALTNLGHHPAAGMVKEDSAEEPDVKVNGEHSSWQAEEPESVNGWQQPNKSAVTAREGLLSIAR